jgi:hypothetical protein
MHSTTNPRGDPRRSESVRPPDGNTSRCPRCDRAGEDHGPACKERSVASARREPRAHDADQRGLGRRPGEATHLKDVSSIGQPHVYCSTVGATRSGSTSTSETSGTRSSSAPQVAARAPCSPRPFSSDEVRARSSDRLRQRSYRARRDDGRRRAHPRAGHFQSARRFPSHSGEQLILTTSHGPLLFISTEHAESSCFESYGMATTPGELPPFWWTERRRC